MEFGAGIDREGNAVKRFLLFSGPSYYPSDGWGDFKGGYDTYEDALKEGECLIAPTHLMSEDWMHVVYDQKTLMPPLGLGGEPVSIDLDGEKYPGSDYAEEYLNSFAKRSADEYGVVPSDAFAALLVKRLS